MALKNLNYNLEDFINNPTKISEHLVEIVLEIKKKYDLLLKSSNFISNFINTVKIRLWYLNKYLDIYNFLKTYKPYQMKKDKPFKNIKGLFDEFNIIYDVVSLNNLLLTYAFLVEKNKSTFIIDKEDKKLLCFKRFYNDEISEEEFKKKYGHYGLNPFELSSRRFSEYSKNELMNLAKYAKNFRTPKKIQLREYIQKKPKNLFPVYFAMREELKYRALFNISNLRFELLKLSKEEKIDNIFQINYKDLIKLVNDNKR